MVSLFSCTKVVDPRLLLPIETEPEVDYQLQCSKREIESVGEGTNKLMIR